MRLSLLYILILFFPLLTMASPPTEEIKLSRRQASIKPSVSLLVPENFKSLTDEEIAAKYITTTRPLAVYSNINRPVELSISLAKTVWRKDDIDLLRSFYKSNIRSLYTTVKFTVDKTETFNKVKFAVLEFDAEVTEKGKSAIKKYTYISYTVIRAHVLIVSFTCNQSEKGLWQQKAADMIKSVKL